MNSSVPRGVLAIRRETFNEWEARAPLSPSHARELIKDGVRIIIQPSYRRVYTEQEYAAVGAEIREDISGAPLILGVKTVSIDSLLPYKTYAFFSHTIKAQDASMPLLDAILEKKIRLIDYEKVLGKKENLSAAFGFYAGAVGMLNILHGLGLRLMAFGYRTPFMHIGPSNIYRNTEQAKHAVKEAGVDISSGKMPGPLGPLIFVVTGSGNVSKGAQNIFQEFPHEYINPERLPEIAKHGATNKLYISVVSRKHHFVRKGDGTFDAKEFEQHPTRYTSTFASTIAPYASVIINGIDWSPATPRLITIDDAARLPRPSPVSKYPRLSHRLLAISDVSADPGGSLEFMDKCTTVDKPFCLYDASLNRTTDGFVGDGVLICSIENMPCQMPKEATDLFGSMLLPYIKDMLKSDAEKPFADYNASDELRNAVIASNGKLTPNYEYITNLRKSKKKVNSGF